MAGNSKPKDLAARSGRPVGDQLKALQKKAERLADEKTILSKRVVAQIRKLIDIDADRISILDDAETKEINVSGELEKWLEQVYGAISRADDLLDYCDYHVHNHTCLLKLVADRKKSKDTGLICGETIHRYLVRPVSTYLVRPVSSCVATPVDAIIVRPINQHLVKPLHSYFSWWKTIARLNRVISDLDSQLEEGRRTQISGKSPKAETEDERSARIQGVVDVSDAELKLVGEETEVDKIVSELLYSDNDEVLSVKRIVGWGETGKTALARAVYKNEEVMFHFDERMWVQVPGNSDKEKIAEAMLTSLTRTAADQVSNNSEKGRTERKLKARLKGKRFLLVLDGDFDVNSSFLEFLQALGGCRDSKILATVVSVPENTTWSVYMMKIMKSKHYCPALFDAISIGDEVIKDGAELKKISEALVEDYCQGDLLNIKLLGSLMKRMKGERRWSHLSNTLNVSRLSNTLNVSRLSNTLKDGIPQLCFDSMSSLPLKRCFQYCCLFPKGYLIQREEITELWMAQGYLNNNTGADMLDLGILYYDILLKSGFLQVSEEDDFERKSCKVPEPLWDVVELPGDYLRLEGKGKPGDRSKGVRHLSLVNRRGKFSGSMWGKISKIQTLCLERDDGLKDKLLGAILASAKSLRVLIIVDGSLEELPSSVGNLKGLKYLDISRTKVVRLPDSISVLYNLQTLRLYGLEDSPKRFENLGTSLRHLYIQMDLPTLQSIPPKFQAFVKYSKGSIKVFVDKNGEIDAWERMKVPNRCSSISIHRLENASSKTVKVQTTVLLMKREVETLKLHWSARRDNCFDEDQVLENIEVHDGVKNLAIENFKGTAFPTWMVKAESNRFLHMVLKLELENCSWCEKLPPLGSLRCLKILRITKMNSVRDIGDEFYHGSGTHSGGSQRTVFPSLKVFILSRMKNLGIWHCDTGSEHAFSSLVRFEVEDCPELSAIPDALVQNRLLKLRIAHCKKLTALPATIAKEDDEFLVRDLELYGLPSWEEFSIQGAKKLKSLRIGCISTVGLPEIQFEHLSSLTSLAVWGYGDKELPSWISQLHHLKILKLELSQTLETFPPELKGLEELSIYNCPVLEDRCMRGSRPEWKKVSRIPAIVVNGQEINRPHM